MTAVLVLMTCWPNLILPIPKRSSNWNCQHLYLAFLFRGDYFHRPDSSLACISVPQRLFRPIGFIPILLFCAIGIIFSRPDASLSSSFSPQGLFHPAGCIPDWLFCSTGIISAGWMHLYLALLLHRDYFHRPNSSLTGFSVPQGLFRPSQMHPPSLKTSLPVHSVNF